MSAARKDGSHPAAWEGRCWMSCCGVPLPQSPGTVLIPGLVLGLIIRWVVTSGADAPTSFLSSNPFLGHDGDSPRQGSRIREGQCLAVCSSSDLVLAAWCQQVTRERKSPFSP